MDDELKARLERRIANDPEFAEIVAEAEKRERVRTSEVWAECKRCGMKIQVDAAKSLDDVMEKSMILYRTHIKDCKPKLPRSWRSRWFRWFVFDLFAVLLIGSCAWAMWR